MKYNRKLLEEETLQKIKEVNDEAGHRKYLEVPEMVEIISSIMEKKMKVFHDSDAELIQQLRDYTNKLEEENEYLSDFKVAAEEELEELQKIIKDTLFVLPVGSISRHTPESIPDRVQDLAKALAEECYLREKWEACADNLIVYAKDYVAHLSDLGEIDHVDNKQIKLVEDVLEQYNRLKNEY